MEAEEEEEERGWQVVTVWYSRAVTGPIRLKKKKHFI